jgi:hypothetical protein
MVPNLLITDRPCSCHDPSGLQCFPITACVVTKPHNQEWISFDQMRLYYIQNKTVRSIITERTIHTTNTWSPQSSLHQTMTVLCQVQNPSARYRDQLFSARTHAHARFTCRPCNHQPATHRRAHIPHASATMRPHTPCHKLTNMLYTVTTW